MDSNMVYFNILSQQGSMEGMGLETFLCIYGITEGKSSEQNMTSVFTHRKNRTSLCN